MAEMPTILVLDSDVSKRSLVGCGGACLYNADTQDVEVRGLQV
jgi:hypothetical protein